MGAKEMAAAAAIESKAKEVVKLVKKYRFHELAPHVAQLKALIEKANKLPDANPYIDPDEIEYPFERQSAYLRGTKTKKVIAKIEEAATGKCKMPQQVNCFFFCCCCCSFVLWVFDCSQQGE